MPERIQRRRTKGWRMPEGAIYVGRPGFWGNPYQAGIAAKMPFLADGTVLTMSESVDCYRDFILGGGPTLLESRWHSSRVGLAIAELRGRDLACWCPLEDSCGRPVPCHADVLLEIANA